MESRENNQEKRIKSNAKTINIVCTLPFPPQRAVAVIVYEIVHASNHSLNLNDGRLLFSLPS
jgi:hypothetical protein